MNAPVAPLLRSAPLDVPAPSGRAAPRVRPLLGDILVREGHLSEPELLVALALHRRQNVPLGELLIARGTVSPAQVYAALSVQHNLPLIALADSPPDPRLAQFLPPQDCLLLDVIPWRMRGTRLVLATSRPTQIDAIRRKLPPALADADFVLAMPHDLTEHIQAHHGPALALLALERTALRDSCRTWSTGRTTLLWIALSLCVLACAVFALPQLLAGIFALACAALLANTALKSACAALAIFRAPPARAPPQDGPGMALRLPKISILVPLFHERNIVTALVARLSRLSYPRELLEVVLVVEDCDTVTQDALAGHRLPVWMKVVRVPPGEVQTKPRALNYALDFTSGTLIGVYDAEDAPETDQLHRVARRFAQGGAKLACLQGALSFYNWQTNWLSRCFFFEYAGWFRVMLPGLQALGFAIPLGGTTLFFRRDVLLKLGAWDAHNVTEDADLGMRLARRGYRCEMIDTTTNEEANSRVWPWIKQRSRWLKGYAVTWCVHMRRPVQLWRELGPWRYLGFQVLFLATLASFFLAPVFWWTLATVIFGWHNPVFALMSPAMSTTLTAFFFAAELATLSVFAIAALKRKGISRPALPWIITLPVYFLFGTIAAYKGLIELVFKPFYWDKTEHGMFGGAQDTGLAGHAARINLEPGLEGDRQMFAQRFGGGGAVAGLDSLDDGEMLGQRDLAPALGGQ